MFLNQTILSRKPGRIAGSVAAAAAILIAWVWEGLLTYLAVRAAHRVPAHFDPVYLLSLAFLAYTAVLAFSSLVFSFNALLLNPDLDLLLVAPRPVGSILAGRMVVQVLRLLVLSLLFTAPALLVLAVMFRAPLILVGFGVLYLLYPIFVVVIVSVLSLLVVRFIPVGRGREILTLLGVLLAVGINLLNFLLNPALRDPSLGRRPPPPTLPQVPLASSPWLPPGWTGRSAAAMLGGDWLAAGAWLLPLLALSAALFALGTIASGRLYLAGWIQAVPPRRRLATPARSRRLQTAVPFLNPVLGAIIIKDWRMRTRDLAQLLRFVMPPIFLFVIFGLRFPGLVDSVRSLGAGPAAAMLALIPSWVLLFSLSISLGLTAISLEGRSIWVYAASPNSTRRLLQAKCWSTALPTTLVVALVGGVAEILIRPGFIWGLTALALVIAQAVALTSLMVGIGAVFARFDWTDARRMMHPAGAFVGMFLFALVGGATALVLVISLALASATRYPLFLTWLSALTISAGGAVAVAALGLLVGNERLLGLEVG
jgi:hypothetical protein